MTTEEQQPTLYQDDPEEEERYLETRDDDANMAVASFWQLIWWRYRRIASPSSPLLSYLSSI